MFKFLIIFFLVVLVIIYIGNYIDYRNNKITRKEFERRIRFFIALVFIMIFIVMYIR
jgi:uncharacterized membrane protein YdjX (TVP38/TMEM64 family)